MDNRQHQILTFCAFSLLTTSRKHQQMKADLVTSQFELLFYRMFRSVYITFPPSLFAFRRRRAI